MGATPSGRDDEGAARRRAFREFVRTHHPDRGGDPEIFLAGLAALTRDAPAAVEDDLVFHRRRRGLAHLIDRVRARRHRRPSAPRVH